MFRTLSQSILASKSVEARRLFIAQIRYLQLTSAIHADDSKEKIESSKDVKDGTSVRKVSKVAPAKKDTIKGKEIIEEPYSVKKGEVSLNENLRKAAVRVARSLPGDWTRTADELLTRLKMHSNPENTGDQETSEEKPSSLLSTMKVSRSSMPSRQRVHEDRQRIRETNNTWEDELPYTTTTKADTKVQLTRGGRGEGRNVAHFEIPHDKILQRKRLARQSEVFSDLFGVPRLGIFDADKIKAGAQQPEVQVEPDLWQTLDEEKLKTVGCGLPRNAFEEMIQLTKEGKLWQFPIDNEADMHVERKYKFHEHVFLEQHLSLFPDKGPVRKFMELITLGLSLNPYITVPEKLEHIRWYAEYFREKQGILESVIGEQAMMKDSEKKKKIES